MLAVHRAERADRLVEALGDLLAVPLQDPIASEVVAVPTRGVERWLTQRLSHRLGVAENGGAGVCANVVFPFPGSLVGSAVAVACGIDSAADPWLPERCAWQVVELIDGHADDPQLAPLIAHLRAATPQNGLGQEGPLRRFAAARHLADLFDHYAVHRPDLLAAWASGSVAGGDGDPTPAWQAHLWQLLRARLGVPSPAERFEEAARRIADDPGQLDLPERVSLFGLTRLPASHLQVLQAIAAGREVHLFLLHPSGSLWESVAAAAPHPAPDLARAADPTAHLARNPLLRSWGRDAREMQLVLAARGVTRSEHRLVEDPFAPADGKAGPPTLLQRLQSDIRGDRRPPGVPPPGDEDPRPVLAASDTSLQVHACHGRGRQVEVLRDALLHLLAEDETLEPRDVIVMCPDIETFAPLVQAAFGTDDPGGSDSSAAGGGGRQDGVPHLRLRLADRSLRQTNPLLSVAAQLLVLAGSRVTASEVLDFASRPAVARRFRFDQDDLSSLESWVTGTGVRWALDGEHRRPWALEHVPSNTWATGLDRLLLGVAMAEEDCRTYGGTLPYGDLPSSALDLAGRVAELVSRLGATLDSLSGRRPVDAWVEALVEGSDLLAVNSPAEHWQHEQLRRVLAEVAEEAEVSAAPPREGGPPGAPGPVLSLDEVRSLLDARLRGRPTRANFRTGDLTVCTLVPMRSVPHRVVALLGLDDGAFPRHPEADGDDLLLDRPRVGDRDVRSEDRQLLLDALLAATERLVITYSGRDERTNRPRPPAVPVAELLDAVDATVRCPDAATPARQQVVSHHPLQPFDPRNFTPGALATAGPWSYDRVHLAGARALSRQGPPRPFLDRPLARPPDPTVQLDDLVSFLRHPVRAFLRRLGLHLSDTSAPPDGSLPVELDNLQKWAVGDRLLEACLDGVDLDRAVLAERSRGSLPPGELADAVLAEVCPDVDQLAAAAAAMGFAPGPSDSLDVHVDLGDGRSLVGTVPGLRGGTLFSCGYARLGPRQRLTAWARFLALCASRPELAPTAVTLGRGKPHPVESAVLGELCATPAERRECALGHLGVLVDLYDRALAAPIPLPCKTSAAWAQARRHGDDSHGAWSAARDAWEGSQLVAGEWSDPEHVRVWGARLPLNRLVREPPGPHEQGPGWDPREAGRFGALARRLWDPLLDHEQMGAAP